jgi:phosphoglycerol transferase MdoB-like AlkP superfamily enzyme
MYRYHVVLFLFIIALLVWDWIFLEKPFRRVLGWLLFFLTLVTVGCLNSGLVVRAERLLQAQSLSDLFIYIVCVLFTREVILSRARNNKKNVEFTKVVRALAKERAERL